MSSIISELAYQCAKTNECPAGTSLSCPFLNKLECSNVCAKHWARVLTARKVLSEKYNSAELDKELEED